MAANRFDNAEIVVHLSLCLSLSLWMDILVACRGKCELKILRAGSNADICNHTWEFMATANAHIQHLLATVSEPASVAGSYGQYD